MKLDEKKIRFMQEGLSVELIQMLMEEWGGGEEEALETFYNSDTFERLSDPGTGLYYQSAGYVYDYLRREWLTGRLG